MRIVFDTLGSTELSGGMRLHSTELIGAWLDEWPDDDVTVVGPQWVDDTFSGRARIVRWPNERAAQRAFGQLVVSARAARAARADALVSLSPIVSPLSRRFTVCFQHDWRHKVNSHEFPVHQRAYRALWEISARHARVNACISTKAATETARYTRAPVITIVPNGWDHARRWPVHSASDDVPHIVTYGHHNNKRPELAIEALNLLRDRYDSDLRLVVLGARGDYARQLSELAGRLGVGDSVVLPGFVDEDTYQRLVSTAAVMVMPSSDEGFGLPIAEALYFGIPAVVTSDSGMPEIFGAAVRVASPTATSIAESIHDELGSTTRTRAIGQTSWRDTVISLRAAITQQDVDAPLQAESSGASPTSEIGHSR